MEAEELEELEELDDQRVTALLEFLLESTQQVEKNGLDKKQVKDLVEIANLDFSDEDIDEMMQVAGNLNYLTLANLKDLIKRCLFPH